MMKDSDLYGQSLYDLASSENLADDILCQMQTVRQNLRFRRSKGLHYWTKRSEAICSLIF